MSQMSSLGLGSSGASPIQNVVTNAGTVTPNNGIVNVIGSTNINTEESSNNIVVSLKNNIAINTLIAGDITVSSNQITSEDTFDINLNPNGLGKVALSYISPNSQLSLDSNKNMIASASMTDGQILIGATGGSPAPSTITAGPGIQITNNPGQITITNSGVGGGFLSWEKFSYGGPNSAFPVDRYQMQSNKGYIVNSWYQYVDKYSTSYKGRIFVDFPPNEELSVGDMIAVLSLGGGGCFINFNQNQNVTWAAYQYGVNSYPQVNGYFMGYGYGLTPSNWRGNGILELKYDQPQAIWLLVTEISDSGSTIYIYKTQQFWQFAKSPVIP